MSEFYNGRHCPYCGSEDITSYSQLNPEEGSLEVFCNACERDFAEIWEMTSWMDDNNQEHPLKAEPLAWVLHFNSWDDDCRLMTCVVQVQAMNQEQAVLLGRASAELLLPRHKTPVLAGSFGPFKAVSSDHIQLSASG